MRYSVLVALLLVVSSCGKSAPSDRSFFEELEHRDAVTERVRKESQALVGASVRVHRAYNYTSGQTWIQPEGSKKVVAVDVEFQGAGEGFDLKDVDVIDGLTNESDGTNPKIFLLRPDGSFQSFDWPSELAGQPMRVLLLYPVPESTDSIKLAYWQKEIVSQPVELAPDGPAMPSPKGR